jgi:DNA mismatch repair protein MutL
MGFRGEALASIAAVAQVELRTRAEEDEIGTHLSVKAGRVVGHEPVSCPVGSNFSVENLFYNVPARRKFLKSNSTELNNIILAFEKIALVYPQISFALYNNGVEVFNLRPGNIRQRIVDIFGKKVSQDLLPVSVDTSMCRISGFVGKPEASRKKGSHQYFFVNGRYMRHSYFHKAVQNAFECLVPVGEQVPYFIYFDVNPEDIDVNIHPTKTEIKFENEQAIWQILAAAVKEAIGTFNDIPAIDFDTKGRPEIPVFSPSSYATPPKVDYNTQYNPFKETPANKTVPNQDWDLLFNSLKRGEEKETALFPDSNEGNMIEDKSPIHYQYKGMYIMTAVKSGLMIIDQYRAHVRILYEGYLQQLESKSGESQKVLFPEVVQFSPSEIIVLKKIMPEMESLGFELTDLGSNSYAVNAIPAGLDGINMVSLLQEMVSNANEKGTSLRDEIDHSLAMSLARSAAIPRGQVLSNVEMENLVNQLFACSNVNYTPDGKTILAILRQQEIEHLLA